MNLKLNGIEYLCLKMAANPGRSGRWYLRELHRYKFGTFCTGSWNALYMSPSGKYRGILFNDNAPKDRVAHGMFTSSCSSVGSFHLTLAGQNKAKLAAQKIGIAI